MVDASLVQQVLPRRLAAKQASASITQQLDDSDSEAAHTQNSSPSPNRVTIKYGRKAKAMRKRMAHESEVKRPALESHTATSLDFNGATTTPLKGRARSTKKRPFLQNSNSQDAGETLDSPLTPVSDPDTFSSTLSPPPTSPAPPSLTPRPFPLMVPTDNGPNSSNHNARGKRKRREPSAPKRWKKKDLGDFVWVLIDDQSRIYGHDETAAEREHVWWPGRIRPPPGGGRRILVYLYGQAAFKVKNIEVSRPTEDNILPFNDSTGEARFHVPAYVTPSKDDGPDVIMSPRKKARRDNHELGERWNSAVLELNTERDAGNAIPGGVRPERAPASTAHSTASEDDNLPEVGEMDWKASLASISEGSQGNASPAKEKQKESVQKRKGRGKGKRKATPISEGESDFGIRRLEEDVPFLPSQDDLFAHHDETLQIPGELILAKGTNSDKNYWPARILEYVPPKSKKEREGKYKIEYLDGITSVVDPNAFYTSEEDGFGTCKLGKFESSYDDTANDSETEGVVDPSRYPSPIPANPPPSKEAYFELDMHSQFVYTKPILVAILNEQYAPARERHVQFLKGGQARKSIVDSAMLRGEIVPESVGELQRLLCKWCLREETLGKEDQKRQVAEKVEELQVNGAETSNGQLETTQSNVVTEDTIESEEATGPPSSALTSATLPPDGPLDPSSVDVTMEDVTDKASPLSVLSSLTNEATPTPSEDKEVKMLESSSDVTESMSDLTELEDPAPPAPKPDAPVSETLPGLPRQYGCPAYEALTSMEKLEYCLNVLLPEAILQILLWRKGLRTATEVLSQDEEERLHTEGAKLLHVTDWVYDVVRLRRLHERKFTKKNSKDGISSSQKSDRGGGRLRKVGRINYHE